MKTINLTKPQIKDLSEELSMSAKCFYHFPTGEVKVFYPNDAGDFGDSYEDEEETDSEYEDAFYNKDDYFQFDSMESHDSFQIMEDFIETVSDPRLVNRLVYALNQRKPFRHFKDVVESSPYRQKWFNFESQSHIAWVDKQIKRHNMYAAGLESDEDEIEED